MVEDERLIVRCPSCTQKGTPDELGRYCEQNCRAIEGNLTADTLTLDEAITIAPANLEELPPVVRRIAEQIERGVRHLSPAASIAGVICSSGDVAAGLAALPVLEQLRARHTKRVWGGVVTSLGADGFVRPERVTVCVACNTAWPCPDAEILGVE